MSLAARSSDASAAARADRLQEGRSPPPAAASGFWSPRRVAWAGGLLVAAFAAQGIYDLIRGYHGTLQETRHALESQSRVIAEQTARSLQALDTVLRHLVEQHRRGLFDRLDAAGLHAYLREQAVGLVQIDSLLLSDADGQGLASSTIPPAEIQRVNVSQTSAFQRLRDDPDAELAVGTTSRAADTARFVFPIGRRLEGPEGEFVGVAGAGGLVDYFQQFYRDAYPEAGIRIALLHRDTTLLARHPPADAALGRKVPLVEELMAAAEAGEVIKRHPSPLDGVDRFGATRLVPGYPLVIVVTRDAASVFAAWRSQAVGSVMRTLGLGALAVALIATVLRQLSRLAAARGSLATSESRYALAAAGSDTGVWDWDMVAGRAYESRRARELQGLPLEPENQSLQELEAALRVHPDDAARRSEALRTHLDGKTPHYEIEYRVQRPDGDFYWVHCRALCIRDAAGRPLRIAGSVADIDARKRADAERQRLEEQLRQAQKLEAIGTLAGGIAHDFNNILSAILGYGELAQKGAVEGSDQWRHLEAAMAAGQRAKSLVERILAFSRSGIGEREPVPVQAVVSEALDTVAGVAPPGLRITRRLAAGDAAVLGDPTQIHQVVMNLCANAIQAMRAEGHLEVTLDVVHLEAPLAVATSTLAIGSFLRLVVTDNGSGMPPTLQARIFDPFFTTKEIGVGTGLGLSLVHGIVTDLGGGIAVVSQERVGSSFTVYLPCCATAPSPGVAQSAAPQQLGNGQTILLVDDEESLVRLGEETLAGLGYEPVGFTSARAALDALAAEPGRFDALLSDEAMPGLTGSQLARAAQTLVPGLPIILVSGYVTPALAQRAAAIGVVEVLAKPVTERAIARALAAALAAGGGSGART